jgi:hypothetical protein
VHLVALHRLTAALRHSTSNPYKLSKNTPFSRSPSAHGHPAAFDFQSVQIIKKTYSVHSHSSPARGIRLQSIEPAKRLRNGCDMHQTIQTCGQLASFDSLKTTVCKAQRQPAAFDFQSVQIIKKQYSVHLVVLHRLTATLRHSTSNPYKLSKKIQCAFSRSPSDHGHPAAFDFQSVQIIKKTMCI